MKDFKADLSKIEAFLKKDLQIAVGKQGVDLFKRNFDEQGFQNGTLNEWQNVQRRDASKQRIGKRGLPLKRQDLSYTDKILIRTRNLQRSIRYEYHAGVITWYSDVKYAEAHNEGTTTAGRGNHTTIPKRQFIGDSIELKNIIEKEMDSFFNKL